MAEIRFYGKYLPYPQFSNFWPAEIDIDGEKYKTSEHYYQSQKFPNTEYGRFVALAPTAAEAAKRGRDTFILLRSDWDQVKDDVMLKALRAKFTQHNDLKKLLLDTGDSRLVEYTKNDSYWAEWEGAGLNKLGTLLMKVRSELLFNSF